MEGTPEFQEIGHCGGKVTITTLTDDDGCRKYQLGFSHVSLYGPAALFAVYALPQGIPVAPIKLGGIGQPWNPSPVPGCVPVMIASDTEGRFGHGCPRCRGYWRSDAMPVSCPYCALRGEQHQFLTDAQREYVRQYCSFFSDALESETDGEHVIDLDQVADAVGGDLPRPPFYYSEQSQQNKFKCEACDTFNDILGNYGYCSGCGTRNDLQHLKTVVEPRLRIRINSGGPFEDCVRDSVAAFDSLAAQYVKQLTNQVPLTPGRRSRLLTSRFHNLGVVAEELKTIFDIDILRGLQTADRNFLATMFYRRHVYEHNGGEADEKYLQESGDKTVRVKQALRETQDSAHRTLGFIVKIATNLHRGFHEILPPAAEPIERKAKYSSRRENPMQGLPPTEDQEG